MEIVDNVWLEVRVSWNDSRLVRISQIVSISGGEDEWGEKMKLHLSDGKVLTLERERETREKLLDLLREARPKLTITEEIEELLGMAGWRKP